MMSFGVPVINIQDEDIRQVEALRQRAAEDLGFYSKCNRKPVTCFKQDELHCLILDWKTLHFLI